ncbi:MAG: aminotransferase class III-fold pyridoxal phosphate-dependent enzyme [Solirubrobacteraceae bacterium]|nr:aminotransferase class III-fold pyridoxal phosphate-dependent enzyme [Solirubrobacteraceae bacterium]
MEIAENLTEAPPSVSERHARRIAVDCFGLSAHDLRPLPGERDQTFRLRDDRGRELVLKIERLLQTLPDELGHVMLTCTGSEANDLAYRMARASTGGTGFIVTDCAYHGVTAAISELSPSLGAGVVQPPTTRTVPAPDRYRRGDRDVGERFAADVRAAVADLRAHGIRPAALLVDTIFSSDGILPDPAGFLAPAAAAIREAGALLITDEVQAGFGRTGTMWGFSRHGVVPDIVTLGKPMGNGHPIAGVVARPELLETFGSRTRYFNTFGGNTVSCAVGMAVLDVLEDEALVENARTVGEHLRNTMAPLAERYELIGDVRSAGLFVGIDLVRDPDTREPAGTAAVRVVEAMRTRRILINATGPHANVLKIHPPLVFTHEQADLLVHGLDEALAEVAEQAR